MDNLDSFTMYLTDVYKNRYGKEDEGFEKWLETLKISDWIAYADVYALKFNQIPN